MSLTSKQRKFLKGLAHPLSPVVRVGRSGVTPSVIAETAKALDAHELVKVRIEIDEGSDRRAAIERLAEATASEVAGSVGKIGILYRARQEKPSIRLP